MSYVDLVKLPYVGQIRNKSLAVTSPCSLRHVWSFCMQLGILIIQSLEVIGSEDASELEVAFT